jgi:hypothetical protein
MRGKNKCKILKQIRQKIADENDIPYVTRECTYQGECRGTCPKCEAELRYLEQELEKRRRLGKTVAVAAVAAGLSLTMTACVPGGTGGQAAGAEPGGTLPSLVSPTTDIDSLQGEPIPSDEELDGNIVELEGDVEIVPVETEMVMGEIAETEAETYGR